VIWVGHSLGTLYGWLEASVADDVDAFVLTGLLHTVKPSWLTLAVQSAYSANQDPAFSTRGFDSGYLTFKAGTRAPLFYWTPGADPDEIALDERLKDTVSGTEFGAAVPLFNSAPPQTAPSRAIRVPTLLVVGQYDRVMCLVPGDPDGLVCNEHNVARQEAPYYSDEARLHVLVVRNTGHDLQLHLSAPTTGEAILDWLSKEGLGLESP
jgi:pimeloyl-ACP methyl ester carboxylesterase